MINATDSMASSLEKDYAKFRQLKSWYKHLPLCGTDLYVYESLPASVYAREGWDWTFDWSPPASGIEFYHIRVGPFLRGLDTFLDGRILMTGDIDIIVRRAGDRFLPWIEEHYPHLRGVDWHNADRYPEAVMEVFRGECRKYRVGLPL
jgi:hypothetical protein